MKSYGAYGSDNPFDDARRTRKTRNSQFITQKRIAMGSGTSVEEINRVLKQYEQVCKLMKQFAGGKSFGKGRFGKNPFGL